MPEHAFRHEVSKKWRPVKITHKMTFGGCDNCYEAVEQMGGSSRQIYCQTHFADRMPSKTLDNDCLSPLTA